MLLHKRTVNDTMNGQRHVVKRQVIELILNSPVQAQAYQDELSRVYRQRIIPLIDQRCSELSDTNQLYRLETLDLELGALPVDNLEAEFVARVDAALSRELDRLIQAQKQTFRHAAGNPQAQSQLELFAFFVHTGCLPWWADTSQPGVLAENLEQLLSEAPEALGDLFKKMSREPRFRQRLIAQYTDSHLIALSGLIVPVYRAALQRDFQDLLAALKNACSTIISIQETRLRQILWNSILMLAGSDGQQYATLEAFYRAVLKRVSAELSSTTLLADLYRALKTTANSELATIISHLLETDTLKTDTLKSGSVSPALVSRLAHFRVEDEALRQLWAEVTAMLQQLPATRQAAILTVLQNLPENATVQSVAQAILQVLQSDVELEMSPLIHKLQSLAGASSAAQPTAFPKAAKDLDLSFSEADEYPVSNAGLVILWPFLGSFFTRLGLLDEEHHFKDFAARQRAVGLLQFVATQDATPPEYLLPLNKLLCGLEVETVFEFGLDLIESEIQECENLLEAVIAQAPILHNMTQDGFRGSFLLRPGILGTRDGMGLLRVERQTYDIVLDRFPWSWEWVKLSWMEAPLRVEW